MLLLQEIHFQIHRLTTLESITMILTLQKKKNPKKPNNIGLIGICVPEYWYISIADLRAIGLESGGLTLNIVIWRGLPKMPQSNA